MTFQTSFRWLLTALALGAGLLWGPARATADEHPDARNTAIDANTLTLDPAGKGVFSTGSAEPLTHLEYRISAVGHHLTDPLVVMADDDRLPADYEGNQRALVAERQQIDLGAAIGLFDRFEAGLVLPITVAQQAQFPGYRLGPVASRGLGNVAVYGMANLLSQKAHGVHLALAAPVELPTHTGDGYFGSAGVTAAPQLRISRRFGVVQLAASGDVRFRPETSLNNITEDDRIRWKSGIMVEPMPMWGIGAEFVGSTPLAAPFDAPHATRGEVLVGGRVRPVPKLDLQFAAGRTVIRGIGAPSFRMTMGVTYHHGRPPPRSVRRACDRAEDGEAGDRDPSDCPESDFDGDGLVNADDKCARDAEDVDEFEDEDGCPDPDNDNDAIADREDDCPLTAEDRDGFASNDGCPDLDNDGDGMADGEDECPSGAEDFDGFDDADGCPDRDNDNDALSDLDDDCPDEAGEVANDGCPDTQAPEATVTRENIEISEKIFFVSDRALIRQRSYDVLEKVGEALQDHRDIRKIEIIGYADERGKSRYNYHLSWERAKVVRQHLIANADIAPERLEATGKGELESGAETTDGQQTNGSAASEREWAKARRVEFKIIERADSE